jgi:hypothetical protein
VATRRRAGRNSPPPTGHRKEGGVAPAAAAAAAAAAPLRAAAHTRAAACRVLSSRSMRRARWARAALAAALAALCAAAARAWEHTSHACAHDALPAHEHVASGVRHAQRYHAHPFDEAASAFSSAHAPHGARRLTDAPPALYAGPYAPGARPGFAPLRVALEWHGGDGTAAADAVHPVVQAWIRHALVPAAAAFWRGALQARAARAARAARTHTHGVHTTRICHNSLSRDLHPLTHAFAPPLVGPSRRCGRYRAR